MDTERYVCAVDKLNSDCFVYEVTFGVWLDFLRKVELRTSSLCKVTVNCTQGTSVWSKSIAPKISSPNLKLFLNKINRPTRPRLLLMLKIFRCVRAVRLCSASSAVLNESTSVRLDETNGLSVFVGPDWDEAIAARSCRMYRSKSEAKDIFVVGKNRRSEFYPVELRRETERESAVLDNWRVEFRSSVCTNISRRRLEMLVEHSSRWFHCMKLEENNGDGEERGKNAFCWFSLTWFAFSRI